MSTDWRDRPDTAAISMPEVVSRLDAVKQPSKRIDATWLVGDTRVSRTFYADNADVSMDTYGSVIQFTNGIDSQSRPILTLMARRLEQVTIRPA